MIALERVRGRLALRLAAERLGPDLAVTLSGGDRPHVGAVAVAQPRTSRSGQRSATTSVIAILGHREDELARELAAAVAAHLGGVVTVACGIHLDDITPAELRDVADLAAELERELLAALGPSAVTARGHAP